MADATEAVGNTVKTGAKAAKNVPPYVWIIAVVGGLGVAYVMNKQKGGTAPDGTNTNAPSALVYTGTGQTADQTDNTSAGQSTAGFQTNEAWAQAAKNWLISQGTDAKEASDAVDLYINAQALNAKQNAMISTVTRAIGAPPQSLPPTTGTPTTDTGDPYDTYAQKHVGYQTSVSGGPSLLGTVYVVKQGDTIQSIAQKAYALAPTDYSSLTHAMDAIINDNWQNVPDVMNIAPGTKLYIPLLSSQEFPGFGNKIPLMGYMGPGKGAQEWEFVTGIVPQSAQKAR